MPSGESFLTVPLLFMLTHVLAPPGPLLPLLVAQCLLIAPNFSLQGPPLPLLVVLTHVLAPPRPLLPLLVVMTHVLALPGPLVRMPDCLDGIEPCECKRKGH
jgi:hypothetical protein